MWKLYVRKGNDKVRKGNDKVLAYSFDTIQEAQACALDMVDARRHADDYYLISIDEVEPEAHMEKQIRVDAGKLYALADAGWKPIKIADELRCSEQTVRNYLNKRKEK